MRTHSNHIMLIMAGVAGFIVLAALGVPIWSYLPFVALLAICPLMMVLMMRGMSHGGGRGGDHGPDEGPDDHVTDLRSSRSR